MATNRLQREMENREITERPKQWMPPEVLPEPEMVVDKKTGELKKPRKKKPVDKNKLVARFKHLEEFAELSLKSVKPVDCIGVTDVWVYNSKTRKLGVYRGQYSNVMGIKANKWNGYTETTSVQKTLRKPEKQLSEFKALGKNQLNKWFESIKCAPQKLNGRGNEFTLILRST